MSIRIENIPQINNFKNKIINKKSNLCQNIFTPAKEFISSKASAAIAAVAKFSISKQEISQKNIVKKLKQNGYQMHIGKNSHGYYKYYSKNISEETEEKIQNKFKNFKYSEWDKPLDALYIKDVQKGISEKNIKRMKNVLNSDKELGFDIYNNHFEKFADTFVLLPKATIKDMQYHKGIFKMVCDIAKTSPDINVYHDVCLYQGKSRTEGNISKRMQDALRSGKPIKDDEVNEYANRLQKLINNYTVPEDLTLYRGEGYEVLNNLQLENGKKINLGKLMKDAAKSGDNEKIEKIREFILDNEITAVQPAFMSTSYHWEMPDALHNGIIWELTPQKGTKGLFLDALNIKDTSIFGNSKNEQEILLQKGSKLKIEDLFYNQERKLWKIKATVSN